MGRIDDLTIAESAFIAGLPKAPSNFNPEKNYARVKERRDYVIIRMFEDHYITEETAKEALATAIILNLSIKIKYFILLPIYIFLIWILKIHIL